jgi:hypothetical protein
MADTDHEPRGTRRANDATLIVLQIENATR